MSAAAYLLGLSALLFYVNASTPPAPYSRSWRWRKDGTYFGGWAALAGSLVVAVGAQL